MMNQVRAHLWITGRVQGVCFRFETQRAALQFHVSGWVRNLSDGRVEALVEGPEDDVAKTIAWCHQGPPGSRVDDVQIHWESYQGDLSGFTITR